METHVKLQNTMQNTENTDEYSEDRTEYKNIENARMTDRNYETP